MVLVATMDLVLKLWTCYNGTGSYNGLGCEVVDVPLRALLTWDVGCQGNSRVLTNCVGYVLCSYEYCACLYSVSSGYPQLHYTM